MNQVHELPDAHQLLARWGDEIRRERKFQNVTAVTVAQVAGISRMTLHRIERGEAGVSIGAWAAVMAAIGMTLEFASPRTRAANSKSLPVRVRLDEFPELQKLAWQLHPTSEVTPEQALNIYERNWRHMDHSNVSLHERQFIDLLTELLAGGRLLV